jgi:hypothetical protein
VGRYQEGSVLVIIVARLHVLSEVQIIWVTGMLRRTYW